MNNNPPSENTFVSVFSDKIPTTTTSQTESPAIHTAFYQNAGYIIVLITFGIIIAACAFAFFHRDWVLSKIGELTLQAYLGKPNEIRRTELPENSRMKSIYENFVSLGELQAF
jgi:hypothetical protein